MSESIVETKNASLDTLSVTILALHVSGKQMTLAVFRQLPSAYENERANLWGIVRYAIKDEGETWLVFSVDGRLFRRPLDLRLRHTSERSLIEMTERLDSLINGKGFLGRLKKLNTTHPENIEKTNKDIQLLQAKIQEEKTRIVLFNQQEDARFSNETRISHLPQLFIAV